MKCRFLFLLGILLFISCGGAGTSADGGESAGGSYASTDGGGFSGSVPGGVADLGPTTILDPGDPDPDHWAIPSWASIAIRFAFNNGNVSPWICGQICDNEIIYTYFSGYLSLVELNNACNFATCERQNAVEIKSLSLEWEDVSCENYDQVSPPIQACTWSCDSPSGCFYLESTGTDPMP